MFKKPAQSPVLGKELLFKRLEQNPACTTAIFDSFSLNSNDIQRLLTILENNSTIQILSLLDCQLNTENTVAIAKAVQKNSTLIEVNIETFQNDNALVQQAIEDMNAHLRNNRSRLSSLP